MPRRLFGICACMIAAVILFGQSGCASSHQIVATAKTWDGGNTARLTRVDLDRSIFGFHAGENFIRLVPDKGFWLPSNSVLKLDPRTLEIMATTPVSQWHLMATLDVGKEAVWVVGGGGTLPSMFSKSMLSRIDSATNQVVAEIPLDGYSEGIAIGEGAIWVGTGNTVTRIDPKTNEVVARIPVGRDTWDRISVGAGAVWVLKMMDAMVYRIDPATNLVVAEIRVGPSKEERRQRASGDFSPMVLLNPMGLFMPLAGLFLPDEIGYSQQWDWMPFPSLTASADAVWVTEALNYAHITPATRWHVLRIDPATNQVVAKIPFQGRPYSVTNYQGFLWVSVRSGFSWIGDARKGIIKESPCYLMKIDPQRNEVIDRLVFPPEPYCSGHDGVQLGEGSNAIWALKPARTDNSSGDAHLWRIDVTTD